MNRAKLNKLKKHLAERQQNRPGWNNLPNPAPKPVVDRSVPWGSYRPMPMAKEPAPPGAWQVTSKPLDKAVRQLAQENRALKQTITSLEARLASLEERLMAAEEALKAPTLSDSDWIAETE